MSSQASAAIGLFYGSSTCYTEMAAEKIRDMIGQEMVDMFNVAECEISRMDDYHYLIMGIPTWDYGELQEDWEEVWSDLDAINFTDKKVAFFGLGDQEGYPRWFLDAMGYLHTKVVSLGATPVGYWPAAGYRFDNSEALTEDKSQFVGLALDDENEFDKSEDRMTRWCQQIMAEFGI